MEEMKRKNSFLIASVSCIVLLLAMCYFGINNSIKGTAAVDNYDLSCMSGYDMVEDGGKTYCCPNATDKIVTHGGVSYCISSERHETLTTNSNGDLICYDYFSSDGTFSPSTEKCVELFGSGWEFNSSLSSYPNNHYVCTGINGNCGEKAAAPQEYKCYWYSGDYYWGTSGVDLVEEITTKEECLNKNVDCYLCGSTYYWGGKYTYTSGVNGQNCTLKTAFVTEATCLVNNSGTYKISYNGNGGKKTSYGKYPTTADFNKWVEISGHEKVVTIHGVDNGTGANIGSDTFKSLTFLGYTFDGSTSVAEYAQTAAGTVNTGSAKFWKDQTTLATGPWFKNLTYKDGSTVTMSANWKVQELTVPTISKDGYTCKWNTKADGSGTDYTSGATYTPDANGQANVNLYAICTVDQAGGTSSSSPDTPTSEPTSKPTSEPTSKPTSEPTSKPTSTPTSKPTSKPTSEPTSKPTSEPTSTPTSKPTSVATPTSAHSSNVDKNPQTGQIAIFIVWVIALATIVYSVWYFKKVKEN